MRTFFFLSYLLETENILVDIFTVYNFDSFPENLLITVLIDISELAYGEQKCKFVHTFSSSSQADFLVSNI